MKLRAKLSGLITAVLLVSLGGCGSMAVTGLLRTNVRQSRLSIYKRTVLY